MEVVINRIAARLTVGGTSFGLKAFAGVMDGCPAQQCTTLLGGISGPAKETFAGCVSRAAYKELTVTTTTAAKTTTTRAATTTKGDGSPKFHIIANEVLADASNLAAEGSVAADKNGLYTFSGEGGGLKIKSHPAALGPEWTITMTVNQKAGSNGYIFAKTNKDGKTRFYALYSHPEHLTLYYTSKSNRKGARVRFSQSISDGKEHQVTVGVQGNSVRLKIDNQDSERKKIAGPVLDCGAAAEDCVFLIGQRRDANGKGTFNFLGSLGSLAILSNKVLIDHPQVRVKTADNADGAASAGTVEDWLGKGSFIPAKNVVQSGSNFRFNGKAGLKVAKHAKASSKMSVALSVRQSSNTRGYLFCKSDRNGAVRYYSLYANPGSVTLYYLLQGSSAHSKIVFDVDLADSNPYAVLLTVDRTFATLSVDDVQVGPRHNLEGLLSDCDQGDNCALFVGARSAKNDLAVGKFPFSGIISGAKIYKSDAFAFFPDTS